MDTPTLIASLTLACAFVGAGLGWALTVESRLGAVGKLVEKMDKLIDLLLERELDGIDLLQIQRHSKEFMDSRRAYKNP